MESKRKYTVIHCPHCKLPLCVPLKEGSLTARDLNSHIQNCTAERRWYQGPLMTRARAKIRSFMDKLKREAQAKFLDEWNRIDEYWKNQMIVCPECLKFRFPADEKERPCEKCKCLMEFAPKLIKEDERFTFVREQKSNTA